MPMQSVTLIALIPTAWEYFHLTHVSSSKILIPFVILNFEYLKVLSSFELSIMNNTQNNHGHHHHAQSLSGWSMF